MIEFQIKRDKEREEKNSEIDIWLRKIFGLRFALVLCREK